MLFKLQETAIPTNFSQVMLSLNKRVEPEQSFMAYSTLIMAMTDFLGNVKSKERKVAISVNDLKGNFLLGGKVSYHKNENEEMPGNWSYELTFDKKELEDATITESTETHFSNIVCKTIDNLHGYRIADATMIQPLLEEAVNVLKQWLDMNAKENEEIELEFPGYFIASVVVENGEKIMSIVPDGAMKRIIKDDSALEN